MSEPGHISPSQLVTYRRCPEAWRRRYVEGDIRPPGVAAFIGTGVHMADQEAFKVKLNCGLGLPPSQMADIAVAELDRRIESEGMQVDRSLAIDTAYGHDAAAAIARMHSVTVVPSYAPAMVESGFSIELPTAGTKLVGFVDLVDDVGRVIDIKTTGRSRSVRDVRESTQLTVYALAAMQATGSIPSSVLLDVTNRDDRTRKVLESTRGVDDFRALASQVTAVLTGIRSGSFPPAAEGSWYCCRKWCGYFADCKFVAGRRAAGE